MAVMPRHRRHLHILYIGALLKQPFLPVLITTVLRHIAKNNGNIIQRLLPGQLFTSSILETDNRQKLTLREYRPEFHSRGLIMSAQITS